jgi:hypothetical protein
VPLRRAAGDARFPVYTRGVRSHDWIDRRSLALHAAVAAKLEADPRVLEVARANVRRWLAANHAPALVEWRDLLDAASIPELVAVLRSSDEEAVRLRQSSPFAGILTPAERQAILQSHEPRCP